MSQWLQEERKKLEESQTKQRPVSGYIIAAFIVLIIIEAVWFLAGPYFPDYNLRLLCGIVGVSGLIVIAAFFYVSKMTADKPVFPLAEKCIENLGFTPEELQQFDAEMLAPSALIQTNSASDLFPIRITEHYIAAFSLDTGEPDYGVFRLSDIAMTCYAAGKSPSNPSDQVYNIDLLNAKGKKMGGISIDGKKYFMELDFALRKYAPGIRLNVSMKEVGKICKKRSVLKIKEFH